MNYKKYFPLGALFLVFVLYSGSMSYPFVYDDLWRIAHNQAIQSLSAPWRFFSDPSTQASIPQLHHDTYRPLSVLLTALQYQLWGNSASDFRLLNILLHALNTTLVFLLGMEILSLSIGAAALAALLFMVHPVQTESVIWISSQSNLLALSFFLGGLWLWRRYCVGQKTTDRVLTHLVFVTALFVRETLVVFPLVCALMGWLPKRGPREKKIRVEKDLVVMALFAVVFVIIRGLLLGQVSQSPLWGGSILAHAANILKTWPLFFKTMVWPSALRVTYSDLPIALTFFRWDVMLGMISLGLVAGIAWALRSKHRPLSFCLALLLVLWLPVSNLIPLRTLFSERFLYPLLVPAVWLIALGLDTVWNRQAAPWYRVSFVAVPLVVMTLAFKTVFQSRVWVSEYDLWANATDVAPQSWFSWASLSGILVQGAIGRPPHIAVVYLRMADDATQRALNAQPPIEAGGELFLRLAIIKKLQGRMDESWTYARRAYAIRPDLEKVWKPG